VDQFMKKLAVICARGGSKGVPGKNTRPLLGKPLIAYTIRQAVDSGLFERVVVSTDSDDIAAIAKKYGAEVPFLRPQALAGDAAPKLPAVKHALLESENIFGQTFDIIIDLDPTSPLRSIDDIKCCIDILMGDDVSNVITAMPSRRSPYFNLIEKNDKGQVRLAKEVFPPISCRQNSPKCYDMNASIYAWERSSLLEADSVLLQRTQLYIMPEERSIDIDSELDFKLVEFLAGQRDDLKYGS
jgi:CMP-N-acetylneuraminic acid synthetase